MAAQIDPRDVYRLRVATEASAREFHNLNRELKVLNATLIGLAMILNDEHKPGVLVQDVLKEVTNDGGEGTGPEAPTG